MHTQCSALLEHYKNTLHKLSEIRLKLMCMCITVECAVCVCPKMNVPLGPSSRQASKLPGNGARENSPQQEPGTTNQCQWMSLDDVMTWASSPLMGGYTCHMFSKTLAKWRWGFHLSPLNHPQSWWKEQKERAWHDVKNDALVTLL